MKEACRKFESIEEEHLAQMSTFMIKIAKVSNTRKLVKPLIASCAHKFLVKIAVIEPRK